jgi:hypothetical protein
MDATKQQQMLKLVGEYRALEARESWLNTETKRHLDNLDLFEAMIRKAFPDTTMVVAGHHIMFMRHGHAMPHEIASADTLIFDHAVAAAVWGDEWALRLSDLAIAPVALRDRMLRALFNERWGTNL